MKYKDFYQHEINENPEVVMGEYPRWEYDSYLFMGTTDNKGLIYTPVKHREDLSHAIMYRTFIKKIAGDIDVKTIGDISSGQFDHELAGVIIPKQNGIEKTLISLWSERGLKLKPILSQLIGVIGASLPAEIEVSDVLDRDASKTYDF